MKSWIASIGRRLTLSQIASQESSLNTLRNEIEDVVSKLLPGDLDAWFAQYSSPKIIHDNLWGTIRLQAHEIALLDTGLIQRLRHIRQTGAVYLTYPSALHTRFEHSVGVLVQASRLCDAVRRESKDEPTDDRVSDDLIRNLRFGSLLHDAGHGPFSHTSEQYFAQFPVFDEARNTFGMKESGPSEILSYMIIKSRAMKGFVDGLNAHYRKDIRVDDIADYVAGNVPENEFYKSEFIHGPFDADKLDYIHRDSIFTGFRMNVDLDRLYYSVRVHNHGGQTRLAGSFAGTAPLTQIMFNKMQLFTSVYHHHKVRTVDCMIWSLFELCYGKHLLGGVPLRSPADFLRVTDDSICTPSLTDSEEAREMIGRIRDRRLLKRALVINRRTVPAHLHEKGAKGNMAPLAALSLKSKNRPDHISWRREMARLIFEQAGRPCALHEIWLDVPKSPDMEEAQRLWIRVDGESEPQDLQACIPVTEWVSLYGIHRWTAHVFCPDHARRAIGKAAATVLGDTLGFEFKQEAFLNP